MKRHTAIACTIAFVLAGCDCPSLRHAAVADPTPPRIVRNGWTRYSETTTVFHYDIRCDARGGNATITLPDARLGDEVNVTRIDTNKTNKCKVVTGPHDAMLDENNHQIFPAFEMDPAEHFSTNDSCPMESWVANRSSWQVDGRGGGTCQADPSTDE